MARLAAKRRALMRASIFIAISAGALPRLMSQFNFDYEPVFTLERLRTSEKDFHLSSVQLRAMENPK
jgi:hypothetical protein